MKIVVEHQFDQGKCFDQGVVMYVHTPMPVLTD